MLKMIKKIVLLFLHSAQQNMYKNNKIPEEGIFMDEGISSLRLFFSVSIF